MTTTIEPDVRRTDPAGLTLVDRELVRSVGWLISLRWLAGTAVVIGTVAAVWLLRLPLPGGALCAVGATILVYNAALLSYRQQMDTSRPAAPNRFEAFARFQMALDWIAMAMLLALSGGIESPALLFFLFHITIAALLLRHRHGFLYVATAPVLVAVVAILEYARWIPHVPIIEPARYHDPVFIGFVLASFTVACYVLAYCCMTIASRLRRREAELSGLYDGVRSMTSTLDLQAVLTRVVEAAAGVLGCRAAAIRLIDPSKSQVEFAACWGLSQAYQGEVPAEFSRSPLDQDTLRLGVVHVREVGADPRVWHADRVRDEGIGTMLSVAIPGRQGPLGVLRAYGAEAHRFSDEDVEYLQAVAAQGSVAIENAKAFAQLAALDRDKSRFLRMTTHELRSPVRVTESLMTALADGYVGALTPEQVEVVARAQRRLASLHGLVDDLLDLAAGKADMSSSQPVRLDLRAVAGEVAERYRAVADEKRLAYAVHLPAAPCWVRIDPTDAERLLVNLVSNAVKYTREGGVTVTLSEDTRQVTLDVADTGIGIPRAALPQLFQEFFRAGNAKAVQESGTGLGLSIVQQIVSRWGGHVSVESVEGQGSRFSVVLPSDLGV